MGWFRVDDEFLTNTKVMALSASTKVLYLSGLAYCSANLTDGRIPAVAIGLVAAAGKVSPKGARELVEAGLWEKDADGWTVHDYLQHQEPSERIRARRQASRERVQNWRQQHDKNKTGNEVRNGARSPVRTPVRTQQVRDLQHSTACTSTSAVTPTGPPPAGDEDEHNRKPQPPWASMPEADRGVLDNLAERLDWTSPKLQQDLLAEWRLGLQNLDRRYLEDTLLATAEHHPRSAKYLHTAVLAACEKAGVDPGRTA